MLASQINKTDFKVIDASGNQMNIIRTVYIAVKHEKLTYMNLKFWIHKHTIMYCLAGTLRNDLVRSKSIL